MSDKQYDCAYKQYVTEFEEGKLSLAFNNFLIENDNNINDERAIEEAIKTESLH
jgi:hypothetical protein